MRPLVPRDWPRRRFPSAPNEQQLMRSPEGAHTWRQRDLSSLPDVRTGGSARPLRKVSAPRAPRTRCGKGSAISIQAKLRRRHAKASARTSTCATCRSLLLQSSAWLAQSSNEHVFVCCSFGPSGSAKPSVVLQVSAPRALGQHDGRRYLAVMRDMGSVGIDGWTDVYKAATKLHGRYMSRRSIRQSYQYQV